MRKPARPIPRGVSPAVDHRCSSHQSAAPVTGVTGCFWSSADRSCPARGPRRRRRQRPVRRPPAAVRCRCGAWRRKGYTPEYEKLARIASKMSRNLENSLFRSPQRCLIFLLHRLACLRRPRGAAEHASGSELDAKRLASALAEPIRPTQHLGAPHRGQ
jgi:hypothetical protein